MSELPILQPIHHVADLEAANDFERKHTPRVTVEKAEGKTLVTVEMGQYVAHPNEPGHFFDWIELYVGATPIARFSGAPGLVDPCVTVTLSAEESAGLTISALASCNLHGIWRADAAL